MHIPENYLSPSTCAIMGAVMVPVWAMALRKVRQTVPKEKLPLLGIGAAFAFLSMMFNIPLPGGTTGHAVGGTLIAVLFGPYAACLSVTIALFIQALFFGDGGLLAFGANAFNMAFVLPFTGYFIYCQLKDRAGVNLAAGIGAYIGINAAAFCAAVEFGIQPLLFIDAAGQPLYCPYPLTVSLPAMMIGHLTLFGLAEFIFTAAVAAYLKKASPDIFVAASSRAGKPVYGLLLAMVILSPIGLLAEGTAWGEWAPEEIAEVIENGHALGYTPAGLSDGFSFAALFPDYTVGALPDVFGYILSAVIGTALSIIVFKLAASLMKEKVEFTKATRGV